jgi:hypothetical protein
MSDNRCPFEKAIISTRFNCDAAERFSVAEREGVRCKNTLALTNCTTLVKNLRENARFSIKHHDDTVPLSYGQDMKIKCGGLLALQAIVHGGERDAVQNIHQLLQDSMQQYRSLAALPYSDIVQGIARYRHRR